VPNSSEVSSLFGRYFGASRKRSVESRLLNWFDRKSMPVTVAPMAPMFRFWFVYELSA